MIPPSDAHAFVDKLEDMLVAFARDHKLVWVTEFSGSGVTDEILSDTTVYVDGETKLVAKISIEKIS